MDLGLFKSFYATATEGHYPVSVKMLYFTLLGEFNKRFWQESTVAFSLRELAELTGLSKSAVSEAKNYLTDRGHIKTFNPKRCSGVTIFQLLPESGHLPDSSRTPSGHLAGHPAGQQPDTARGNSLSPTEGVNQDLIKTIKTCDGDGAGVRAGAIYGIDRDILNEWRDNVGNPGNAELNFLHQWSRIYGKDAVIGAIREAVIGNRYPRISVNYVKKILENKAKGEAVASAVDSNARRYKTGDEIADVVDLDELRRELQKFA